MMFNPDYIENFDLIREKLDKNKSFNQFKKTVCYLIKTIDPDEKDFYNKQIETTIKNKGLYEELIINTNYGKKRYILNAVQQRKVSNISKRSLNFHLTTLVKDPNYVDLLVKLNAPSYLIEKSIYRRLYNLIHLEKKSIDNMIKEYPSMTALIYKFSNLKNPDVRFIKKYLKIHKKDHLTNLKELEKRKWLELHGDKNIGKWHTQVVIITDPRGKEHKFEKKLDALTFIAPVLKNLGLVVKADRITQLLKDGKILMSRPAGTGSGKGNKEWYDATPGWTFSIQSQFSCYTVNGCPNRKLTNTINHAIKNQWIPQPTEIFKSKK